MSDIETSILPLKSPKTFEEQLSILQQNGLTVESTLDAINILIQVNYYRFSGYLLPFKNQHTKKYDGASFGHIFKLCEFDRRLRFIILSIVEPVEILLKTKIAYYHGHKYGPGGYTTHANFLDNKNHTRFLNEFKKTLTKNSKALFVKHHNSKYGGEFPIWVATELFSLGMLSKFYSNMISTDKKHLARNFNTGPEHLESWLHCLADLRNRCAHYMRLYFYNFVVLPRFPKNFNVQRTGRLFDIIYVMQSLYLDKQKWETEFLIRLEALLLEDDDLILPHLKEWGSRIRRVPLHSRL
jgi:abortive infection bacteriophage resistance protein